MRGFPEMTEAERAFASQYEMDAIADSAPDTTPNMHHGSGRAAELKARSRTGAVSPESLSKVA